MLERNNFVAPQSVCFRIGSNFMDTFLFFLLINLVKFSRIIIIREQTYEKMFTLKEKKDEKYRT